MEDGYVTLLIRSPSLKREEREVRVPRDYTVLELKAQLRRELPGEPMEQEQRLIYSGKLLPNNLKLNEVLSKESRHVLHLVCATRSAPVSQVLEKQPVGSVAAASYPMSPSSDGVRQRISADHLPTTQTGVARRPDESPQGTTSAFTPYSVYSPQQILWLQQMYARHYYMQYLAAATSTGSPVQRVPEIPVVAAAAAPDQLAHPFPADNPAANLDVQPPVNPAANPNLHLDARGRLLEEEDDVNRDWLHWIYTAARFSIFLSILYFYSSVSRFMMVLGAMILMYLHHAGLFPFRRPPVQEAANQAPQAVPNNQDQNNNLQEENAHREEAFNTAAAALQAQSFVTTAWVFFKTFFASLIPEGPAAVA